MTGQTPISGSHGSSSTYSYDTIGAQTQAASTSTATYGFNAAGQMTSVTTSSGGTTYLYNGDGLEASATTPGTVGWNAPVEIDSVGAVSASTCTSSTFCVAVDIDGYATVYNGTTWSTPSDIDGSRILSAVTCTSSSFCVAVDDSGYATRYNGTSWSTPTDIDGSRSLDTVSCSSSSFCVAAGSSGYQATFSGTSWATSTRVDSTRDISQVSCVSSSFCIAGDASGYSTRFSGSSWSTPTDVDSSRGIDGLTCTSTTFCMAVDSSGYAVKYNGTSWSTPTDVDGSRQLNSVACTSSSFCVAVGTSGYVTTYNGTSWATASRVDSTRALSDVSCASTTFCVAVDISGYETTYNGSSWTSPRDIDTTDDIFYVSCPSTTFCGAVDGQGYAILYEAAPSTVSQLTWDTGGALANILSDGSYVYIYGASSTPVEEIKLATSTTTFMTYTTPGATWFTTNTAGDETGFYGYDAFGNLSFGTPTSSFGFAGQYLDALSGLSDMRARWYSSQVGQFTTVDPEIVQSGSAYIYSLDDPVNTSDPSGLIPGNCYVDPSVCAMPTQGYQVGGSATEWANALMSELGAPANTYNAEVVGAWMQSEGGWTSGDRNPLSSGECRGDTVGPNGDCISQNVDGIWTYKNLQIAVVQTAINLQLSVRGYPQIIAAFRRDTQPNSEPLNMVGDGWNVVKAITASPWGTPAETSKGSGLWQIYFGVLKGSQTTPVTEESHDDSFVESTCGSQGLELA